MTQTVSAVAIFCEDIRNEAGPGRQNTIVGTLPDNIQADGPPIMDGQRPVLPKFGVYLRVNIDIENKPNSLSAKVVDASGATVTQTEWTQAVINSAYEGAKNSKMPVVGFIF